jgi:ferritin-like protein
MSSESLHEPRELLAPETIDRHRAIISLYEELEAIDWYDQRIDATSDRELRQVLQHNRDEEKEHASMVLEWLRRHDPALDENLRTYLFTERPLGYEIEASEGDTSSASPESMEPGALPTLGIGAMFGRGTL